jgi:hypothetical protein
LSTKAPERSPPRPRTPTPPPGRCPRDRRTPRREAGQGHRRSSTCRDRCAIADYFVSRPCRARARPGAGEGTRPGEQGGARSSPTQHRRPRRPRNPTGCCSTSTGRRAPVPARGARLLRARDAVGRRAARAVHARRHRAPARTEIRQPTLDGFGAFQPSWPRRDPALPIRSPPAASGHAGAAPRPLPVGPLPNRRRPRRRPRADHDPRMTDTIRWQHFEPATLKAAAAHGPAGADVLTRRGAPLPRPARRRASRPAGGGAGSDEGSCRCTSTPNAAPTSTSATAPAPGRRSPG